ncbi:MAG: hypothetical protein ACHQTF_11590 [Gemmatimonadales bacterium]
MQGYRYVMFAAATVAVAACNPFHRTRAVEIKSAEVPVSSRWNATLATPTQLAGALQVQGSAWMAPGSDNQTLVYVSVMNAAPGGQHPWHVHLGTCGNDQGILGPADAYKSLKIDGDGKASQQITLPVPIPTTGQYHVNVHASSSNMGTIIACGNLAPPLD